MKKIRKAIFPVAGLGTRFLPVTKASPKEMLPIVDKPLIQYAVEEALESGIEELIFVTSGAKRAIEDHFDRNYELEEKLREKKQFEVLKQVESIVPKSVTCVYIRQAEALGLGHAVLCARQLIEDEFFAVLLADDLISTVGKSCLEQMVEVCHQRQAGVLAVQTVKPSETRQYGIVEIDGECRVQSVVEKPEPDQAPSNLAVVGRYILSSDIFTHLEQLRPGAGGELQLTDAIAAMLKKNKVYTHLFHGVRYDCGSKLGYLKANIEYALKHPELGAPLKEYLSKRF